MKGLFYSFSIVHIILGFCASDLGGETGNGERSRALCAGCWSHSFGKLVALEIGVEGSRRRT